MRNKVKTLLWKGSGPTVNRRSTDSQSQRHYSLTLLILLLFTLGIGQMWADTDYVLSIATTSTWEDENAGKSSAFTSNGQTFSIAKGSTAGTAGKVGTNLLKLSKNATYTITLPTGFTANSINFKGYTNDGSTSGVIDKVNGSTLSESFTFPLNTVASTEASWGDFSKTITGTTGTITFHVMDSKQIGAIITISGTPAASGPVDPTITFNDGAYTIGGSALDLSTLFDSNSNGTVTYSVKTDGGTSATIDGSSFTASAAGTATVTASQAAGTGYNAGSAEADIVVSASDPCATHFYFYSEADQTSNGKTNSSIFTNTSAGSSNMNGSITIGGTTYNTTRRSGDPSSFGEFAIPASKAGTFYALAVSSGSSARKVVLTNTANSKTYEYDVAGGSSAYTTVTISNLPTGTYSVGKSGGNTRLGMMALKVCDATYHTITLELDGGTGATSVQALDGTPATKPADPTKAHCTFAGWVVKSTSAAYDWTANVTSDITLKATWTQLYTVTYAAGDAGATGDAPTQEDLANGAKFTVAANTFAVDGKDFVKWNDGTNDYAPGAEYTIASANVTLTAQWKAASAKYTVHYMDEDGTTPLGDDELVEVGQKPAGLAEDPTKALFSFAAWQKDAADIALDDAFWATVAKDAEVTLTASWAKAYASTVNFADDNNSGTLASFLPTGYTCGGTFSQSEWGKESEGANYFGYKLKDSNVYIELRVAADKRVTFLFGNYARPCTIKVGDADATTVSLTNSKYIVDTDAEVVIRLTTTSTSGTTTLKSITIEEKPAVSDNANLSDLKVGGVSIAGFDAAVTSYYYEMPYGTAKADLPLVTVETAEEHATVEIQDAKYRLDDTRATIKVTAQNGSTYKFYYVYFYNAPKYGVCLVKGNITNNAIARDAASYLKATEVTLQNSGVNGQDPGVTSGSKFQQGSYIKLELPAGKTFKTGDMLVLNVTKVTSDKLRVFKSSDNTAANVIGEGAANMTVGINHVLLTEDAQTLYLKRGSDASHFKDWNPHVTYVAVYRQMAPFIEEFKIGDAVGTISKDELENNVISVQVPYNADLEHLTPAVKYWANGNAQISPAVAEKDFSSAVEYTVSSGYAEDATGDYAPVTYTVTVTKEPHYEAQIGTTSYATLAAAVAAAQADDVVKLLDNVDLMATGLTIAENITLDLNGFNIKAGEQIDNDILVPAGKKLTLVDNSANAEGKIYTEQAYTGAVTGYGLVRVAGELLMQSGNIYAVIEYDPANLGQFAVVLGAGGKATIEGGQIKAGWYAISNNGNNTGSTIIVSGGELISTADFAIYNPAKESTVTVTGGVVYGAAGGIAMNRGELTVTGGIITSKDQGSTGTWGDGTGGMSNAAIAASGKYESVEVEISGGTIIAEGTAVMITNGTTNPVEVAVSGGQFSHVVPAEYCAEGFAPVTEPNAQGKYEVEDKRIYIFNGSTMSDMAESPSAGAITWAKVGSTMSATSKNGTYDEVSYTKALQSGNSSTTKHFRIDVALNNNAKIEVIGMSNSDSDTRHAWLTNSTEKGDFADAIAGLTTTGYNPAMFATDWLEEGSYYLHADNTVNIFLIRVTEKAVDPKCEIPTITTQPATDLTFGAGNMTATVVAEVSDGGTLTYQWYNADGDVAVAGQTTATLTTAVEGTYYVIVTNTLDNHRDNSIKSDEAQLAHRVLNDATLSALGYGDPATAIALVADKYDYRVDLTMGTTDVPALSATATMNPYPTVVITDATEFVDYEATSTVLVTAEDGITQKTYTVKFYVDHEIETLVDVTGNMTWDFSKDGLANNAAVGTEVVMANVEGVVNNDDFHSDNIMVTANKQSGTKLQASMIKFHTTVPGAVIVKFANTSSKDHYRYLVINDVQTEAGSKNSTVVTYAQYVPAGDVVLTVTTADGGNMFNFTSVEFKLDNDLEPARTDDWLAPGELGTICIPQGAVAVGADIYELVGKEPQYGKIVFETVEHMKPGKPYLFQAKGNRIDFILTDEAEASEPDNSGAMKGTFVALNLTELENVYYFAQHALWGCVDLTSLSVPANRAYVKLDEVESIPDPTPAPGRRRISLGVNGQTTTTGFEALNAEDAPVKKMINGQLFILRGEKLYDATGRLVK